MEPEVGISVETDRSAGRPRPSLLVRMIEILGLALVILGFGGGQLWLALLGGALIVGSYAIYRRKHGSGPPSGSGPDGPDSDADEGGD